MKNSKSNKINIIFSSFLIIGYIVCTYFFSTLANQLSGSLGSMIQVLIAVIFGLLLFYATRVGEGKQIRRFSPTVLILVVLPSCFIILAGLIEGFPLHDQITSSLGVVGGLSTTLTLACVALGYGIPYTFVSGYEIQTEDAEDIENIPELEKELLKGGLAEELAETEAESAEAETVAEETTEVAEDTAEETVEETVAEVAEETATETAEEAETAEDSAE